MKFQPDSRVSEVLSDHPELLDVFRRFGFNALANPVLRATLARRVTIEEACERHRVRTEEFLKALDDALASPAPAPGVAFPPATPRDQGVEPSATDGVWVHPHMNIGEVVARYPETRVVFAHFFGDACFTCPSFGMEDLHTACLMHGTPVDDFVGACNQVVTNARGPAPTLERKTWVSAAMTVNDILRNYPEAAPVVAHYGIDSCCGGAHPLAFVCQHHEIDLASVLADLDRVISEKRAPKP